jgi:hypothetical protein
VQNKSEVARHNGGMVFPLSVEIEGGRQIALFACGVH